MEVNNIKSCYDAVANAYATELFDELSKKPLDRILLTAFAAVNNGRGILADLGCGPGQTTQFLTEIGIQNILGIDLSGGMIEKARALNPGLQFETGDMLNLAFPDDYFGSAVAFYAIVHFNNEEMIVAFKEIYRALKPGGQFLLSFHVGDELVHRDEFFGAKVDVDFYFFQTGEILKLLKETGFEVINALERYPYEAVEYPSKRGYLWVEKV